MAEGRGVALDPGFRLAEVMAPYGLGFLLASVIGFYLARTILRSGRS
jgi:hypothetical protein